MELVTELMDRYGYDQNTAEEVVLLYEVEERLEDLSDFIDTVRDYTRYV